MKAEIICLEEDALFFLLDKVVEHVKKTQTHNKDETIWLNTEEAMELLGIKSKTSLYKLRVNGEIRYTQPQHKVIMYDKSSILAYLDKHSKQVF